MGVVRRLNSTFSLSYQVSLIRYRANPICTCSLALVYMAWYAVTHACCPYLQLHRCAGLSRYDLSETATSLLDETRPHRRRK